MIEKDNYLLYMVVINMAPSMEWNENASKEVYWGPVLLG